MTLTVVIQVVVDCSLADDIVRDGVTHTVREDRPTLLQHIRVGNSNRVFRFNAFLPCAFVGTLLLAQCLM